MKSLAAPKTWGINRSKNTFVTRPYPGAHKLELGISLNTILKDMLNYAATSKETKKLLNMRNVLVNGKRVKEPKHLTGLFDTISIEDAGAHYRIMLNENGKIGVIKTSKEDAGMKPSKIIKKTVLEKGKIQINLSDGRNIIADKDSFKTGDTLIISLPGNSVKKHIKLAKGALVFLTGGKHIGETGFVQGIIGDKITYKNKQEKAIETSKKHAFVIGEDKPAIGMKE